MIDENRTRLRASCNACNESKVRCSQQKPTCTRCERNETECIYGLSQRTHKDAPPISIPPSQRGGRLSRPGRPPRLASSGDTRTNTGTSTNSNSTSKTATWSNGGTMPDEPTEAESNNGNLLSDYVLTATETDSMHGTAQLLDFTSLVTGSTSNTAIAPRYFSTTGSDYTNPIPWVLESLFGANHNSDGGGRSNDQQLSFDVQLAKG